MSRSAERRRMVGRTCSMGAASAALAIFMAGCTDYPDAAEVCTRKTIHGPVRANDEDCNDRSISGGSHGYYYWQLNRDNTVHVPPVGSPLPAPGTPGAGSYVRPNNANTSRVGNTTSGGISRGGLGGGGAKGGSSGS